MNMYATDSASLTLQPTNSFRDVSFSSYLNKAEENMIRKLTIQASDVKKGHHWPNKTEEDEELGVFGAEKYFKGEIDDQRSIDSYDSRSKMHNQDENIDEFDHNLISMPVKLTIDQLNRQTPSVRSSASSINSRVGLLPSTKHATGRIESGSKNRSFLAKFACNCVNKKSIQINDKKLIQGKEIKKSQAKMLAFDPKTDVVSTKFVDRKARNDFFSFPVLNSNDQKSNSSKSNLNSKSVNLAGKTGLSVSRKLTMLNDWDVDIPTEEEMYIPSSAMYNHDVDSDSSSDLFEIESFSTAGNNSFVDPRKSNCYAPSEVSVDWSVVTASAADFSMVSDFGDRGWRISGGNGDVEKKRSGILSSCTGYKAVRVAEDEYKVSGGGGGARRRLSESMTVGSMFRGGIV